MRIFIAVLLVGSLVIGGCTASTDTGGTTGTVVKIVDVANDGEIQGVKRVVGTEGYLATVELDDGTSIDAELSGFDEPIQVTTGETKVTVEESDGTWVVVGVSE